MIDRPSEDDAVRESTMYFDSVRVKTERAAAMMVAVPTGNLLSYAEMFGIKDANAPEWFAIAVGVADGMLKSMGQSGYLER